MIRWAGLALLFDMMTTVILFEFSILTVEILPCHYVMGVLSRGLA